MKFIKEYLGEFPFLIDEMIQFPSWLRDGTVCIDEVGSAFPSVRAMSTINVLFTNMLTQLRKRKLEISFTTQFPQMISYGVLTQVDLFILCEKVANGRAVTLGKRIFLNLNGKLIGLKQSITQINCGENTTLKK